MNRRRIIKSFLGLGASTFLLRPSQKPAGFLLLQHSAVAGFQYYSGEQLWSLFQPGQSLIMQREPENFYDHRAVALYWHNHKIGYLPRRDNAAVSQLLDRGQILQASIVRLEKSNNPWQRMQIAIQLG